MIMSSDISGSSLYSRVIDWSNLLVAYRKAAKGKRGKGSAAAFEHQVADRMLELQSELADFSYRPGGYVHFMIHDPKRRRISAAPFRDRVVHHALCNVIEPIFEQRFIPDSYANRRFKGTHKAIDRLQAFSRKYRYVLRIDIVKHFPSIDHAILRDILAETIEEDETRWLIGRIIQSGEGVLSGECQLLHLNATAL
jgi:retron-type reverse transcriptase